MSLDIKKSKEKKQSAHAKFPNMIDSWMQKRHKNVCKPCWELNDCPYGPLVEQMPPFLPTREEAIRHNNFLITQMRNGAYDDDKRKKKHLQKEISSFNPSLYPNKYDKKEREIFCTVFGHVCPVFLVSEQ